MCGSPPPDSRATDHLSLGMITMTTVLHTVGSRLPRMLLHCRDFLMHKPFCFLTWSWYTFWLPFPLARWARGLPAHRIFRFDKHIDSPVEGILPVLNTWSTYQLPSLMVGIPQYFLFFKVGVDIAFDDDISVRKPWWSFWRASNSICTGCDKFWQKQYEELVTFP